jgi:hypothetical protein
MSMRMDSNSTPSAAAPAQASDISYCVTDCAHLEISHKIKAWIDARRAEGWQVDFTVRNDDGRPAVMWQCTKHDDQSKHWQEFTACIGMCGREFRMN